MARLRRGIVTALGVAAPVAATRRRGFTLIELVVVTTVVAVLAAISIPKLLSFNARRVYIAAHELASHIKLARDTAMATQRRTWVDFDTSADSYSVYIEDPDDPGRGNRLWMTHPVTGGNFQVILGSGDAAGVGLASATFRPVGGGVRQPRPAIQRPGSGTAR